MKPLLIALTVALFAVSASAQVGQSFETFSRLTEYTETKVDGNKHSFHNSDDSASGSLSLSWLTSSGSCILRGVKLLLN
jgi:hypothetical protein